MFFFQCGVIFKQTKAFNTVQIWCTRNINKELTVHELLQSIASYPERSSDFYPEIRFKYHNKRLSASSTQNHKNQTQQKLETTSTIISEAKEHANEEAQQKTTSNSCVQPNTAKQHFRMGSWADDAEAEEQMNVKAKKNTVVTPDWTNNSGKESNHASNRSVESKNLIGTDLCFEPRSENNIADITGEISIHETIENKGTDCISNVHSVNKESAKKSKKKSKKKRQKISESSDLHNLNYETKISSIKNANNCKLEQPVQNISIQYTNTITKESSKLISQNKLEFNCLTPFNKMGFTKVIHFLIIFALFSITFLFIISSPIRHTAAAQWNDED